MPAARPPALTIGEILRRSARPDTFGRKVALIQGDSQITYAELRHRAPGAVRV